MSELHPFLFPQSSRPLKALHFLWPRHLFLALTMHSPSPKASENPSASTTPRILFVHNPVSGFTSNFGGSHSTCPSAHFAGFQTPAMLSG
eukprot:905133-Pleurochrysis_carterae.AAC.1